VSESFMSLEFFERELERYKDWKETFKVALKGLVNNKFTHSLREINETNLMTLELRNPDSYATIKDRRVREALVISELFQVDKKWGPKAIDDLELCWDIRDDLSRLLRAIVALTEGRMAAIPSPGGWSKNPYSGVESVKIFLLALNAVISNIYENEGKRFKTLHRITHGIDRKYGTPLDEIRISTMGKRPPIEKALRRIMKVNKLDENP